MSEFLRHDFALYVGSLAATGTVVPSTTQRDRDGGQYINCSHWNSVIVQLTGAWVGTLAVQFSNDGVNWSAAGTIASSGSANGSTISTNGIATVPVLGKYVRLQCTVYTSGTIVANLAGTAADTAFLGTQSVQVSPNIYSGAGTFHHLISSATTNATSAKASAGVTNSITLSNNGAAVAYVKFYDKASAPTVGTDTPVITALVPINGTITINCGYCGIRFPTGIAYAITGGMAVADTTAVGAAQVSVAINYT